MPSISRSSSGMSWRTMDLIHTSSSTILHSPSRDGFELTGADFR
jgi:hypothetical protein